jgi:uncharacterized surface protein with fasciclin (FAS1) repeats
MKAYLHFGVLTALFVVTAIVPAAAQNNPCGTDGPVITTSSYQYLPNYLEIEAGTTVAWVNTSGNHDVNGIVNSLTGLPFNNPVPFSLSAVGGTMAGTCMGTITFDEPGTYSYDCSIGNHAQQGMVGTIVVSGGQQPATVVEVIVNSPDHTTLETAVIAAGLADDLSGEGPFTVFAPTDAAFAALPAGTIEAVLADEQLLNAILTYHVAAGEVLSTALTDGMEITTLNGASVTVSIMGGTVMINNATVTVADLVADNGVVHVIDAVLLPPAPPTTTVVDIIVNSPDHTTLETAVIAAGLADDLSGDGPFTVFAPTDAAFAALPAGTIEAVLADPVLLNAILTYHVAAGNVLSTDLSDGMEITTLNGASVTVSIMGGTVMINDATVTVADLVADNGVVHVINAVLLPPTGVQEASAIAVDVFPNPASDAINFRAEFASSDRIVATDASGRITFEGAATPALDVTTWAAGLYTLSVVREGKPVFTTRVAISH